MQGHVGRSCGPPGAVGLLETKALRVRKETVGTESTFSLLSRPRPCYRQLATTLATHTLSSPQETSQSGMHSQAGWTSGTSKDLKARKESKACGVRQGHGGLGASGTRWSARSHWSAGTYRRTDRKDDLASLEPLDPEEQQERKGHRVPRETPELPDPEAEGLHFFLRSRTRPTCPRRAIPTATST